MNITEKTIIKLTDIVTPKEKEELINWILDNKEKDFFMWSGHPGTIRRTTRFSENVVYPELAFTVQNRIKERLGITTNFYPKYPFGMVATYGHADDECSVHTDPVWYENHFTFHCILMLSKSEEGGVPIIDGIPYPMEEGEGLCYPVSEIPHGTDKMIGDKPRILWIFGYSIPLNGE
jgi:hypothetical protein